MAEARAFVLQPYNRNQQDYTGYVAITPQPVAVEKVIAAWSYAVRYTAKGIDLPDYEKAAELMKQRHPSWQIVQSRAHTTPINLQVADDDEPET